MKNLVKLTPTTFGKSLDIPMPKGCDVIVLAVMAPDIKPLRVLLPHQVYEHDLKEWAKAHGSEDFVVLPYNSRNFKQITSQS